MDALADIAAGNQAMHTAYSTEAAAVLLLLRFDAICSTYAFEV